MKIKKIYFNFDAPREIVYINLSTSFSAKNKCKYCLSGPEHHFISYTYETRLDPNVCTSKTRHMLKHLQRVVSDYYLKEKPSHFTIMGSFKHHTKYKGYNPDLHQKRGHANREQLDFMVCGCWRTFWSFPRQSIKNRPEQRNRLARYNYPRKFDEWG